jgi:hypothetical protein
MSIYRTTRFFESRFLQQAYEIYIEISFRINLCHVQAPGETRLSAKNTPARILFQPLCACVIHSGSTQTHVNLHAAINTCSPGGITM